MNVERGTLAVGRRRPKGAVLVAVLVCLLVVMLLGAALVKGMMFQHRHARTEVQRLQSLWLAESAVSRAAARLRADLQYGGETWQVNIDGQDSDLAGAVLIQVEPIDGQPNRRRVQVEARWPDDPLHRALHRKQVIIHLTGSGDSP